MKRRRFSPAAIAKVWERQGGLCACGCKEALVVGEYDREHEIPLWTGMDEAEREKLDTIDNLQLMIRRHHKPKTAGETTQRAKETRIKAKNEGTYLNASQRELKRMLDRTRQLNGET